MNTSNKITELKNWKFALDQTGYGEGTGWAGKYFDDSNWADVKTNTCWETYEAAMFDYEGMGWFRTKFTPKEQNKQYILHFNGVGGVAKVFVNGSLAGTYENRYLPFEINITRWVWTAGENTIAVLVDNSFRGKTHLTGGPKVEWVLYGGLTHAVWVEERRVFHLDHVRADTDHCGNAKITVTVGNHAVITDLECELVVEIEELNAVQTKQAFCPYSTSCKIAFEFKDTGAKPWSPDAPNLYTVKVSMFRNGELVHWVKHRFGFRTITTKGTEILLNGKPLLLKGANRYDEYAPYGICPPEECIREDMLAMKKAGMNLIRTHYPQDPIHYDLADELGLMYMIEIPLNWWAPTEDDTLADHVGLLNEAVNCLDDTYFWHCNHPSWTIWSVGNECSHSMPAAQAMFRMLAERIRGLDCGRLVTYAANRALLNSTELDFCDILCMNYYSGIKSESVEDFPVQLETVLRGKLKTAQELYPNVPHVMSEFGYVCVAGIRGSTQFGRYAEDFGTTFLKKKCEEFLADPQMKGLIIWSWADYRHRRDFKSGPVGMGISATYGPWGLVTMDRKPKQALLNTITEVYNNWNV